MPPGVVLPPVTFIPDFTFSPADPGESQTVLFDAAPTQDPDGAIVSVSWDFGDGGSATGNPVSHGYAVAGTYAATLTVGDAQGRTRSVTKTVEVSGGPEPKADIIFSPQDPLVGQTVFFDGTASTAPAGRSIVEYAWDFGETGAAKRSVVALSIPTPAQTPLSSG